MKKFTILIIFFLVALPYLSVSQDTITVLQYNLLYFGADEYDCNQSNNNVGEKIEYLKTIINYSQPDIFSVNELSPNANYHNFIRDNVFKLNGYENFERGEVKGDFITNQIFYNSQKLTLQSEDEISAWPRYTHVYKFYYNSLELINGDTAFFYCIVAHLKGGSDTDDEETRASSTANVMNFISTLDIGNYIFMGDLNLYSSTEPAYQNLIATSNPDLKLNDPVDAYGNWHNNDYFAEYHTQSTFYDGNGCSIGGGLDDRFDFILLSNNLMQGSNLIKYIPDSYNTLAQDGEHFNSSVDWEGNNSVPSNVLEALANNSDHLPVSLKLEVNQTPISVDEIVLDKFEIKINNPIKDNIYISIFSEKLYQKNNINIDIYSSMGKLKISKKIKINDKINRSYINVSDLKSGLYLLKFSNNKSLLCTKKIIKI